MTTQTADKKADRTKLKLTTPEFRVSFPSVFEAKKVNETDAKAKFSVQMLFRVGATKESTAAGEKVVDITALKQAVANCLTEKFGADKAKWPKNLRLPFRDGKEKDYDGYGEGVIFVGASSTMKPGLVDSNVQPIITPNEFYGGCYARATINPYYYDVKGNKGVAFGLQNIQKLRDGEPFSGRAKAEDDFDAIAAGEGGASTAADPLGGLG